MIKLSLVIPAKSKDDPKLADLLQSISAQDFPKDEMEVLVITEGTSESAKAIGIRKAKGDVIGILASDNVLSHHESLSHLMRFYERPDWEKYGFGASFPSFYEHDWNDDILNRYFALIGGNDPLAYYMRKNDRFPYWFRGIDLPYRDMRDLTIGDNGFFILKSLIERTDLDNYYHIDNAQEAIAHNRVCVINGEIKHNTGGSIVAFFHKRYRYGLQHAFNKNRRWHLVDFHKPKDIVRLLWFILATLSIIHPLILSIRGYLKIRDVAWFLHPVVCLITLFTYTILTVHIALKNLFQSSFARTEGARV